MLTPAHSGQVTTVHQAECLSCPRLLSSIAESGQERERERWSVAFGIKLLNQVLTEGSGLMKATKKRKRKKHGNRQLHERLLCETLRHNVLSSGRAVLPCSGKGQLLSFILSDMLFAEKKLAQASDGDLPSQQLE